MAHRKAQNCTVHLSVFAVDLGISKLLYSTAHSYFEKARFRRSDISIRRILLGKCGGGGALAAMPLGNLTGTRMSRSPEYIYCKEEGVGSFPSNGVENRGELFA